MSLVPEESEIELLRKTINDLVLALAAQFDNKISAFEKTLDLQEQQMAMLAQAVAEQGVLLESFLVNLNLKSEEEQRQFHETYSKVRNKMFSILKDEPHDDNVERSDSDVASTAENVVDTEPSDDSK
jgi:selenocysteine-specific translation elongation factor